MKNLQKHQAPTREVRQTTPEIKSVCDEDHEDHDHDDHDRHDNGHDHEGDDDDDDLLTIKIDYKRIMV